MTNILPFPTLTEKQFVCTYSDKERMEIIQHSNDQLFATVLQLRETVEHHKRTAEMFMRQATEARIEVEKLREELKGALCGCPF